MSVILTYIQIFASYFCGILLYFFPGIITYRQFALIMAVISSMYIFKGIISGKGRVSKTFFIVTVIALFALLGYRLLTPALQRGEMPSQFNSNFLAIAGQVFPSILTACLISQNEEIQERIKAWAPYIAILFTLIALVCTLRPATSTSAHLTENLNGFDYQVVSYVAAYSSGLLGFYLVTRDGVDQIGIFKTKAGIPIAFLGIFLDLLITLLSGGRGGFVTFVLLGVFTAFLSIRYSKISLATLLKAIAIFTITIVGGYIAVRYVTSTTLSTVGFSRILSLLSGGGDYRRAAKRVAALSAFGEKPFLGHGLGSVFYVIGEYTHNFFTDALVEGGSVLVTLLVMLFVYGFKSAKVIIRRNSSNVIWAYVFLCGFIMSMFSGYYLTHFPLWWGLIFIIAKARNVVIEGQQIK